jgi:hypothetical protein
MSGAFGTVEVAVSALLDSNALPGGATSLWVRGRDAAGNWGAAAELAVLVNGGATDVGEVGAITAFAVEPNVPNPFVSGTRIRFALPEPSPVTVRIFNIEGRLVRTLLDGSVPAGRHSVEWNGRDDHGSRVASGLYLYRIDAGAESVRRKMVLLR